MDDLAYLSIALASLLGLTTWARSTHTRAWGEPSTSRRAKALLPATLLLQACTAWLTGPWVTGITLIAAAWMLLGAALVQAMNQWPAGTQRWALRLGWLGMGGCAVTLAAALTQGIH